MFGKQTPTHSGFDLLLCLLIESTIPSCSFQRSKSKQFVISGRREQIPKIPYLPKNLKKLPVFSCVYVFFPNIRRRGYTSLPTRALPRHRSLTSFALDAKEMAKDLADVPGSSFSWLQLASRTMTFNGCVFQRGKKPSEMKPMGSSHQIEGFTCTFPSTHSGKGYNSRPVRACPLGHLWVCPSFGEKPQNIHVHHSSYEFY